MNSADNFHEKLRQLEYFRLENERLQSELDAQKVEIVILRRERDSLVNTVSKLDTELTEAEYQRYFQAQLRNKWIGFLAFEKKSFFIALLYL